MSANLNEIRSLDELNRALDESKQRPVLLFKHSLTCPISARAFREFKSFLEEADPGLSANLITVQTSRAVSSAAAEKLSVEHHSPQAIIVRNGREVWNASHFAITSSALEAALRGVD